MILSLYNTLRGATLPYTSFTFGVRVTENLDGKDLYPLTHIEIPILSSLDLNNGIYTHNIVMYVVQQRVDKTAEEELQQLNECYNLATRIIRDLYDLVIGTPTFLTYSGIVDNQFSDDCNGVRVEFQINTSIRC